MNLRSSFHNQSPLITMLGAVSRMSSNRFGPKVRQNLSHGSTVPSSQTIQFCFVNWWFHCIILKTTKTLILNVNTEIWNGFLGPKSYRNVRETGPWNQNCIPFQFPPTPTILRTSGFHCKLCIFRFLPTTMSKSWYIVVCLSICLFACLCVCHSLFLTLTAVVFITDKPFSFWLDKRWTPKVRQCGDCVGPGRAHEHGILDLRQSSTCDGCWKQA